MGPDDELNCDDYYDGGRHEPDDLDDDESVEGSPGHEPCDVFFDEVLFEC